MPVSAVHRTLLHKILNISRISYIYHSHIDFFFINISTSFRCHTCQDKSSLQGCQRMTGLRKEECTESVQLFSPLYTGDGEEVTEQKFSLTRMIRSVPPCVTHVESISSVHSLLSPVLEVSLGKYGPVARRSLSSGGHHLIMPRSRTLNSRNFLGSKF